MLFSGFHQLYDPVVYLTHLSQHERPVSIVLIERRDTDMSLERFLHYVYIFLILLDDLYFEQVHLTDNPRLPSAWVSIRLYIHCLRASTVMRRIFLKKCWNVFQKSVISTEIHWMVLFTAGLNSKWKCGGSRTKTNLFNRYKWSQCYKCLDLKKCWCEML